MQRSVQNERTEQMARPREFNEQKTLEKAMDIFWQKGYEATSIQDLVEHLGIGRRSLYNTYTSKRELFLRSLEHYQATVATRPLETIDGVTSMKEAISKLLGFFVEDALTSRDRRGCFVVNTAVELGPHDADVRSKTIDTIEGIEALFYQILVNGNDTELATNQDLRVVAQSLMNTVLGIRVLAKIKPDQTILNNIVDNALAIFH